VCAWFFYVKIVGAPTYELKKFIDKSEENLLVENDTIRD